MPSRPHASPSLFRSLLAGFLCVLVFGLGLLVHSPSSHAWLHADTCQADPAHPHSHEPASPDSESPHANHFCGLTAFAQGTDSPAPALFITPPPALYAPSPTLFPDSDIRPSRTRHLLPPGRAPPTAA